MENDDDVNLQETHAWEETPSTISYFVDQYTEHQHILSFAVKQHHTPQKFHSQFVVFNSRAAYIPVKK
jgi:hypothetical protein